MATRYANRYWRGGGGIGPGVSRLSSALRSAPGVAHRAALIDAQTRGQELENAAAVRALTAGSAFTDALSGFDATDPVARRRVANLAAAADREGSLSDLFTAHSVGDPALTGANLAARGDLGPNVAVSVADRDALIANAAAAETEKALALESLKQRAPMTVAPGHSVYQPGGAGAAFTAPQVLTTDVDERVLGVTPGAAPGSAVPLAEPDPAQVAAISAAGGGARGSAPKPPTYHPYHSRKTGQTIMGRVEADGRIVDRSGADLPLDAVRTSITADVAGEDIGLVDPTKPTMSKQEQAFDAHDKLVGMIRDVRQFVQDNPGVTGLVGSVRRGVSGVFGQLQDVSEAMGWDAETKLSLEERANAIRSVMPQGEPGSQAEAASVFLLKMLDLAYTRAKAFDQGGRLSDQDLERQLTALGGGVLVSGPQFLEKMSEAHNFSTRERERLAGNLGENHAMVQAWRTRPSAPTPGTVTIEVPDDVAEAIRKAREARQALQDARSNVGVQ